MQKKSAFIIYTKEFLDELVELYEKIGTFNGVKNKISEKYGISISDSTIKYKIFEYLKELGRNFEDWFDHFNKNKPKYSNEDIKLWKQLYEKIGSFLGVSKYLELNHNLKVNDTVIKKKLERLLNETGNDFEQWRLTHDKSNQRSGFKDQYSEEDAKEWADLYKKFGSYKKVAKEIKRKYGKTPTDATVKRRIKQFIEKNELYFDSWEQAHSEYPVGEELSSYSDEDVLKWETLYERIGSFQGVSDYIKEIDESGPSAKTIQERLEKKFFQQERDINAWIEEYEDWHFKLYTEEDVKKWIKLYERIGSFYGVEKFLRDKFGIAPDNYTIYTRIKQKFDKENRNFEKWRVIFGQQFFEEVCRIYFEQIFNDMFPKSKPKWLINPLTGYNLHLDGYNMRLRLAFEYNGPQHYEFTPPYHKNYADLQDQHYRDTIKMELCNEMRITFIAVPYWIDPEQMQNFIVSEYEKLSGFKLPRMPKFDYKQYFTRDSLDGFL